MENLSLLKNNLRQNMLSRLAGFCSDAAERAKSSQRACDILLASALYKSAPLVCAFCSMPNEIETFPVIMRALRDGKKVALPRVTDCVAASMDFFILDNTRYVSDQLSVGAYGIRGPRADLEKLGTEDVCRDTVFLVPGIAFDKSGARLGRGKAFYDKYFSRLANALRVGFCFPFQIVEKVPHEPHDIRMTHIISDKLFLATSNGHL